MSGFPVCIYDGDGVSLDRRVPDLTQAQLDTCDGRTMVVKAGTPLFPPTERVWFLDDGASPAEVPQRYWEEAVRLMLDGKGIVILAREEGAIVDSIRERLIELLALAEAPGDAVGYA